MVNQDFISFVQETYRTKEFIPLHAPIFIGNEKKYLSDCIDSTFVSSVGKYVDKFEEKVAEFTGANYAIATVNGTSALHIALLLAGVKENDEVITQPLTFVATCNAIAYLGAKPIFIDVDRQTLGLSPDKLEHFLTKETQLVNGECINKTTKRRVKAVVPMHTFGMPVFMDELILVCNRFNLQIVEDAAESLGSFYKGKHSGTQGLFGTLSFNGNKTITTGGGGMIITNDPEMAKKAKHLTTTAKLSHPWEFEHDRTGYNYRLPNINAALGCAQMESLPLFLEKKRELANRYKSFFENGELGLFFNEHESSKSNYWLNTIILDNLEKRDIFLEETNDNKVMTRPVWKLMNYLIMYKTAQTGNLENAEWLEKRIVNIPSSVKV